MRVFNWRDLMWRRALRRRCMRPSRYPVLISSAISAITPSAIRSSPVRTGWMGRELDGRATCGTIADGTKLLTNFSGDCPQTPAIPLPPPQDRRRPMDSGCAPEPEEELQAAGLLRRPIRYSVNFQVLDAVPQIFHRGMMKLGSPVGSNTTST